MMAGIEGIGLASRKMAEKRARTRSAVTSPSLERYANISLTSLSDIENNIQGFISSHYLFNSMIHISKEQEPLYHELKQIEKEMRNAAEQAKIYENSLALLNKTIKKNELTMKQLERMGGNRSIYVPLGRAFLRKDKDSTIREFNGANEKLLESSKEMEAKIKVLSEKANEKYKILREGTDRLTKK